MNWAGKFRLTPDARFAARVRQAAARANGGERVRVRVGRRCVAIVPLEDLQVLERLEDEEDLRDLRASRAEAKRRGTIPWDQVKASLDLAEDDGAAAAPPAPTEEASAVDEIRVSHDAEGRTLTVWFGRPEEEHACEEVGGGVVLIKDGAGVVIGIEKLGFVADVESLRLALVGGCCAGDGVPTKGTECASVAASARARPVRVEKGGRVVGVLVSGEDFDFFRRLLEAEESRLDIEATREALREVGSVSLEELVSELGL